ncbi:UDP-N-acetylglucosamine--N-acetylmuramyl-(pentapeptide) pyrophosphoryl-undecaprenol N-acetylglucosamine transferase [Amycolatopsis sp. WAC 04182]|uniref:UDP-N-acetylglucosamine--N-acetylmuramyl- (pentapeptide) pyrophosphoryl-undecaprenol N-acetylglucosamine transferase n=1 Tax=Amycolatopsis sp. WAC 04182 TaxID=2203198 RepID=UPI000F78948C|nr:UDP-N-acetylglucosamine--N-acetylmuramyl-(pentapeptide) pyrophosphoryl-undecaprenol N-acetylglucosamine transferase [Amycolatopsis sp. WAC 04182]RSN60660.1 UDP-N-acetylglucosamine--N-acetylmuramyl-(pentapeptide) pyrophosphoryl-undecaprenol N-acetylglucosamine transferase [Amycolatopsis sp. WAC 04182]
MDEHTSAHASTQPREHAAQRPFRLLVTGGGTGGHTYPALTAVRTVQARLADQGWTVEVLWVGNAAGLEARVTADQGIPFQAVATGKIRRARSPLKMLSRANVTDMARVPLGVLQARSAVARFRPDVVLATGGYVAVPVGVAARLCGRPLVIHEQTLRLGLANRVLARFAVRVAVSSESTLPLLSPAMRRRAVATGNPVRSEVFTGEADRAVRALGLHGFDRALPTVYVTGGAQGATQINDLVTAILPWLLEHANVVHQCGPTAVETQQDRAAALPTDLAGRYLPVGFVGTELPDLFALADVVISRSGAGTIAELTALGKASVLIPLASSAGGEQAHNARHLAEQGAAAALLGTEVTSADLRDAVAPLLTDSHQRRAMAARARELGRPDAADRLVDVVLDAAGDRR